MADHRPIPDAKSPRQGAGWVDAVVQAEKLIQIALVLPCAAFIGWLLGAWLDGRLHQSWIGLFGIVFGGLSGLVYVVRLALSTAKQSEPGGQATAEQNKRRQSGS
jgi:ATP synthase protein I